MKSRVRNLQTTRPLGVAAAAVDGDEVDCVEAVDAASHAGDAAVAAGTRKVPSNRPRSLHHRSLLATVSSLASCTAKQRVANASDSPAVSVAGDGQHAAVAVAA